MSENTLAEQEQKAERDLEDELKAIQRYREWLADQTGESGWRPVGGTMDPERASLRRQDLDEQRQEAFERFAMVRLDLRAKRLLCGFPNVASSETERVLCRRQLEAEIPSILDDPRLDKADRERLNNRLFLHAGLWEQKAKTAAVASELGSSRPSEKGRRTEAPSVASSPAERRPGRKADVERNAAVATILQQYGADWRKKLDEVSQALNRANVTLPASKKWHQLGCKDWLDVFVEDKEGLVKALKHRLDWVSKPHCG